MGKRLLVTLALAVCMATVAVGEDGAINLTAPDDGVTCVSAHCNGSSKSMGKDWPFDFTTKGEIKTAKLLPGKEVKKGDTWEVSGDEALKFGAAFKETPADTLKCTIKCTLDEIKDGKIANVKIAVDLSVNCRRKAGGPGGRIDRNLVNVLNGNFLYDTTTNKVTELNIKSDFSFTEQYANNYINMPCPGKAKIEVSLDAAKSAEAPKKDEPKKEGPKTGEGEKK